MSHNKTLEDIKKRRSIRSFLEDPIPMEALKDILEAALYAPSASNHRLSLLTAIQNAEVLKTLNDEVRKAFSAMRDEEANSFQLAAKRHCADPNYNFYYGAPSLIIASCKAEHPNAMADCAAALENIFIAATSLGIGSCWINQLRWLTDSPPIRTYLETLGIPADHMICGAAALGYAKGDRGLRSPRMYSSVKIIE